MAPSFSERIQATCVTGFLARRAGLRATPPATIFVAGGPVTRVRAAAPSFARRLSAVYV